MLIINKLRQCVLGGDRVLLLALVLSFFSGIQGIQWGRYDCLNLDRMAFRSIAKSPPFHPGNFDKPPLLPYINNILINEPTKWVAGIAVAMGIEKHKADSMRRHWRTVLSLFLQWGFYAAMIICAFLYARDWFGLVSARVIALLLATCSGLVPYKIFLTVDLPLTSLMMICLYLGSRIMKNPDSVALSVAAGAFAGLATAMKYNGLGIAVVLPLAHFLAPGGFFAAWRRKSFYLAGISVPVAFVLANPYSVLDAKKFVADFMYNYTVTPVYGGETGSGYGVFLAKFPQIFGFPLTVLLPVLVGISLLTLIGKNQSVQRRAMVILAVVFGLYYYKMGGFPRVETRFVLPMLPVVLLLTAPAWQWMARWRVVPVLFVVPLSLFGLASGWYEGNMFVQDPRMAAIEWARANMPRNVKIDSCSYLNWKYLEDHKVEIVKFPTGLERNEIFSKILGSNPWVHERLAEEKAKNKAEFFSVEALRARNPDYIAFASDFFSYSNEQAGEFLKKLLAGELGYHVVFDGETPAPPAWIYPINPEFVRVRYWILARD